MNYFSALGKTLDQPLLVSKFAKRVPSVLAVGATALVGYNTYKAPSKDRRDVFIKNTFVLGGTVVSALIATRGIRPLSIKGKQLFKGFEGLTPVASVESVKLSQSELIENFLKNNRVKENVLEVLNKAKSKVLKVDETKFLFEEMGKNKLGKEFLNNLVPNPENITSKKILSEIGRLSFIGLVPVVGGIAGGIAGDKITEKDWKSKLPNKIKEGAYQYLANIFMCNIGAAAALGIMEKAKVQSKAVRAGGMVAGIITTGVMGGSAIANYLCGRFVDPIFNKGHKTHTKLKNIYNERKPEALDIGLHTDDLATVAVMSGLRWIEPVLPVLYSVSGYRAGIGYRNGCDGLHGSKGKHHSRCMHKQEYPSTRTL